MDAYCLSCARPAVDTQPGIDARHPLVLCRWTDHSGPRAETRGHGWAPGSTDPDEVLIMALRSRAIRARKDHQAGKHAKRPVRGCDRCAGAIEHRRHVKSRHTVEGCAFCALAHDRTAPARHAR